MPIGASALLSSKIVKDATLKVYPGAPHGLAQTTAYKDTVQHRPARLHQGLTPESPGG